MIAIQSLLTENALADEFVAAFQARRFDEKFFYWFPLSVRAWLALCSDRAYRNYVPSRSLIVQPPARRRAPAARAAAAARLAHRGRRDLRCPAHRGRVRQSAQPPLRLGAARGCRHHRAGRRARVRRPGGRTAPWPAPARQALPRDPRGTSRAGRRDNGAPRRRAARPESFLQVRRRHVRSHSDRRRPRGTLARHERRCPLLDGPRGPRVTAAVDVRGLAYALPGDGRTLVQNVSFTVGPGETLVLLGRSGSGKTTTLKLINRLLEPTAGEVLVAVQPP